MAWFAGRFLPRIPATDACKKWAAGTLTPFGVLKYKSKWGGVVRAGDTQLQVALYAGLFCKRGVPRGMQKAQNAILGQVELENGWPVGF